MTREGKEYGRRKREGSDEDVETDRIVREIINEVRREIENEESPEPKEHPEHEYDPEQCVREVIKEIQQEEAERCRLEEQKESKEKPPETKEKVETSEEWDVDECVRTVIREVQEEEVERQRLREEREHAEMEKEQQIEASYESRKETADKDELDEYEKRIREGFEEHGIDPEEVQERWRKKFEEEVQDEMGEKSRKQTEGEDDEDTGQERTAEGRYYYDDGSGQVYEVQMDSKESSGSETEMESSGEVQEKVEDPQPEIQEDAEVKKESKDTESKKYSGEVEPEKVTPTQETEDVVGEKSRKEVRPEQEEIPRVESEEIKQEKKETIKESAETSSEGHSEDTEETSQTPEKGREKSSSTPETNTKRKQERTESEGSQDTEENVEEKSDSREKEIWTEYEIKYGSLEDENHKRAIREIKELLPEEEQEKFNESVREKVQTIEDFEDLARKHGLDEILEDEEVMEEIRNYLKVRRTLEQEPDTDIEELAEEMGIDAELAEEWSRGESEPYSLKKLLNLEAFYIWDEIIRSHREQNHPESREEVESILESNSELKEDRLFPLEQDDAIAYVEIMAMRRRGEIQRRIRNGREVYSRKQIMELSKKYSISAHEIISWLRGISVPNFIKRVSKENQKQESSLGSANDKIEGTLEREHIPWIIKTMTQFQLAIQYHNELRFWETFDKQYEMVRDYLNGKTHRKPKLLKKLETLGLRRAYEETLGCSPQVKIDSMDDVERLHAKYKTLTKKDRETCQKYFDVIENSSLSDKTLAKQYGISKQKASRWRNRIEPPPISKLRRMEEDRILDDWANRKEFAGTLYLIAKSHEQTETVNQTKSGELDLIDLCENVYFYFATKDRLAKFLMNIKRYLGLDSDLGLHNTVQRLNKILTKAFPENKSKKFISLRYNRIKGAYLKVLLKLSTWSTDDLEKSISRITDITGRSSNISNPRFLQGKELEVVLSRIIAIVISDSHLRSNGAIIYHEPDLRRIRIVEKYLQNLGNITLNPIYDKRTNHYIVNILSVVGKMLLKLGLTPGNKTIHNPCFPEVIFNFSESALCAVLEELIPQDGTVTPTSVSCSHSHTLHPGIDVSIQMKPLINQEEVDLVKDKGTPYEHYSRLSIGLLKDFAKSKDSRISKVAKRLLKHISENLNNFIEGEVRIATLLGIKVVSNPQSVFYHKRTGAVTISWGVRTTGKFEAIRFAMIAPPNDVKKKRVMHRAILDNPAIVEKILSEHRELGIVIRKWWEEELIGGSGET